MNLDIISLVGYFLMNSEIVKCYGYLTVIKDIRKKYHSAKIYKCRCVGGKEIEVISINYTLDILNLVAVGDLEEEISQIRSLED